MLKSLLSFLSSLFGSLFYKKTTFSKSDVQQEVLADREAKVKQELEQIKSQDTAPKDLSQEDVVRYWKK